MKWFSPFGFDNESAVIVALVNCFDGFFDDHFFPMKLGTSLFPNSPL